MSLRPLAAAALSALALTLGACQESTMLGGTERARTPIPQKTAVAMQAKGMTPADPILVRAYKKEAEMEVWKRTSNGQYALLKTFPICRWSGQLGPKIKQGDRQAPEGFYTITPGQMNPNSSYYLSFDVGYPNAIDRAKGGTGNYIMVHGTCSSAGCFAMTDASIGELYALARESFTGGQRAFQFQSYPFRMTAQNMAKFRNDPNAPFWKNLKEGSDYFEALKDEPRVASCGTRYVFGGSDVAAGSCTPKLDPLVAEKRDRDNHEIAELVAKGEKATRVVYQDGDQNPVFRQAKPTGYAALLPEKDDKDAPYTAAEYRNHNVGVVSTPETLAAGPQEFLIDAKGKPVMMAEATEGPGPTKAAAAALAKHDPKNIKPAKAVTAVASAQTKGATEAPEVAQPKPARITVADADGDTSAYHKLLGNLFDKSPAPATPATDAATVPSPETTAATAPDRAPAKAKPAHAARATAKPSDKPASTKPQAAVSTAQPTLRN